MVHWLNLLTPNAGDLGPIPCQGTRSLLQLRVHKPQLRSCMRQLRPETTKYIYVLSLAWLCGILYTLLHAVTRSWMPCYLEAAGLHCALCPGRRPICTNQGRWFPGGSGQWGVSAGGEERWERREEGRRERGLLPRLSPCRIAANQPHPQSNPRVLAAQRPVCCSLPAASVLERVSACSVHSAIPWAVALQAPLSLEFSRQQYWSGLPFPNPGGSWLNPRLLHRLHSDSLPLCHVGRWSISSVKWEYLLPYQ